MHRWAPTGFDPQETFINRKTVCHAPKTMTSSGCQLLAGGRCAQSIPHRPAYPTSFAGYLLDTLRLALFMGIVEPFSVLSEAMADFCRRSTNDFTRLAPDRIAGCFELDGKMPDTYGWRMSDVTALQLQVAGLNDHRAINRVFWEDQARNVEAYATMTFWRGSEILKAAIRSLNVGEVVTPAILARSLLELTSTYLFNANTIEKFFSAIQFPQGSVVTSSEFE